MTESNYIYIRLQLRIIKSHRSCTYYRGKERRREQDEICRTEHKEHIISFFSFLFFTHYSDSHETFRLVCHDSEYQERQRITKP